MPDNLVDLTVTSPPYDNLRVCYNSKFDFKEIATELFRVTKDGGVVVWIVNDATIKGSESGTSFKQALGFIEVGFKLHDTMIWEKPHFANPSSTRYHQIFEYMFILVKGKIKTFNPIKDVPIKYGKPFGKLSQRHADGQITNKENNVVVNEFAMRKNIWRVNTVGQENIGKKPLHPAQFPESLVKDHILSWSNPGDLVFDPFLGSGTTVVAAVKLGRNYLGCDISKEYYDIAVSRLPKTKTTLFRL